LLTIPDLHVLATTLPPEAFEARLGPFVLVQRPPDQIYARVAMTLRTSGTIRMAHRERLGERILTMMDAFRDMWVFSIPRLAAGQSLVVGRAEECAIRVDEPSVSKRHAEIRWSPAPETATLRDLGSSNGTFLNARAIGEVDMPLADGDALSFGDASFLFVSPRTLHAQLLSTAMGSET
jgi:hypothetical protein